MHFVGPAVSTSYGHPTIQPNNPIVWHHCHWKILQCYYRTRQDRCATNVLPPPTPFYNLNRTDPPLIWVVRPLLIEGLSLHRVELHHPFGRGLGLGLSGLGLIRRVIRRSRPVIRRVRKAKAVQLEEDEELRRVHF